MSERSDRKLLEKQLSALGTTPARSALDHLEALQTAPASRVYSGLPDAPFAVWLARVVGKQARLDWRGPSGCEESRGDCFLADVVLGECGSLMVRVGVWEEDGEAKFQTETS